MISLLEHFPKEAEAGLGGKGAWLARLHRRGLTLPVTLCISTEEYSAFADHGGLGEKIAMELHRKPFTDMRWEEIWDAALRIRHHFLKTPMPKELRRRLFAAVDEHFGDTPVAVRSSSPAEDGARFSFAGLHDSFVSVRGKTRIERAVKNVWASLWSDRALLYRKELMLSAEDSGIAVIIQNLIEGKASGIGFTRDPLLQDRMTVEAVHGLNQGLVDGTIAPDRWSLSPDDGAVLEHTPPAGRPFCLTLSENTVAKTVLAPELAAKPPLDARRLADVASLMTTLHEGFGGPLDIEWTVTEEELYLLQVRPVTALRQEEEKDQRTWYLSLHRSFDNLQELRHTIEEEMLPALAEEAARFAAVDPAELSEYELAREIRQRQQRSGYWTERYWRDCIPFAHGIRLFGEIYNAVMVPDDPHEFVELLQGENMLSMQRNAELARLADMVRESPALLDTLNGQALPGPSDEFVVAFDAFVERHGGFFSSRHGGTADARQAFAKLLASFAVMAKPSLPSDSSRREQLEKRFLRRSEESGNTLKPAELLELGRASYRIRDDDNIYLGRLEHQAVRALTEGRKRLADRGLGKVEELAPDEVAGLLEVRAAPPAAEKRRRRQPPKPAVQERGRGRARQLTGQPASQGIARGPARVVTRPADIADFRAGEVLVVEAVEPTMTFFAPLAAAIVEQRGGMLIHGAIIAREYGIPCITGITNATKRVSTGDMLTVDGYLGIVTIDRVIKK